MSDSIPPRPESSEIHTKSAAERFVIGSLFGATTAFFSALLFGDSFGAALTFGLACGAITGTVSALFGKRVFDFLIELITHFT
jgi:hypothetical protein